MAEYRHGAHAVFDLKYHVVWITKYRHQVLRGDIAERARAVIRQICAAREVTIIRGAVSPDHIHMLVSAPPQLAPAKLVQFIKGGRHASSTGRSRVAQAVLGAIPVGAWGPAVQAWVRWEKTIREYIENQRWDDDMEKFKMTSPREP